MEMQKFVSQALTEWISMTIEWIFPVIFTKSSIPLSIYVFVFFQYPKAKTFKFILQMRKLLTLHSNAFLWPVFHLSGKDSTGPHTDHVVSHVELQRVKAKHFNPEKPNFHRRVRALEYQRHLQGNVSWQYLFLGTCQDNGIKDHIMHALALLNHTNTVYYFQFPKQFPWLNSNMINLSFRTHFVCFGSF